MLRLRSATEPKGIHVFLFSFHFGSITLRLVGEPAEPQRAEKSNHPFGASVIAQGPDTA